MAISGFIKGGSRYSEDPMLALPGELIEVLMQIPITAAGFTSAAAGDIPLGSPNPGSGKLVASGGIPPGNWRIRTDLSRLQCPAGTATSDLDLGLAAYTKADGTSQALQGALLADSLDVGGGAINQNLSAVAPQDVNSLEGIGVVCSFDTANSPATGSVTLNLVLQKLPLP